MVSLVLVSSLLFAIEASASSALSLSKSASSFIELRAFHLSRRRHPKSGQHYFYLQSQSRDSGDEADQNDNIVLDISRNDNFLYQDESNDYHADEEGNENDRIEAPSTETKKRFRARAAYCGTAHSGWQAQRRRDNSHGKELPIITTTTTTTIQGEIEQALSTRFRRTIPVVGASRTDAGVHARGQAFHFDLLSSELPPPIEISSSETTECIVDTRQQLLDYDDFCSKLQHSMNRMLPSDVRIFNLQPAPPTTSTGDVTTNYLSETTSSSSSRPWHAIQSAKAKWYSYRFTLGPTLSNPMDRYTRTLFVHRPSLAQSRHLRRSTSSSSSGEIAITTSATVVEQQPQPHPSTKLDTDRLRHILKLFEGTHDFRAFGGQLEQNEKKRKGRWKGKKFDTVRTVYTVELIKEDGGNTNHVDATRDLFLGEEGNYRIDFLLQGALYKMVRNMVGTAMECWLGRMSEEQIVNLLARNDDAAVLSFDEGLNVNNRN